MAKWSTKNPHHQGNGLYCDGNLIATTYDDKAVAEIARKMNAFDEMPVFSHAYCDNCKAITPVTVDALSNTSACGKFRGRDITCETCAWIIAAICLPMEAANV